MKHILLTTSLVWLIPFSLNAEIELSNSQLAGSAAVLVQGIEDGNTTEVVADEVSKYALGTLNSGLNFIEDRALATTNFTHLELSLGSDTFGLNTTGSKISAEIMSVYRLYEDETTFLFNQSSLTRFNNRTTLNTGLGARYITPDEKMIFGANAFYDYEIEAKHKRTGLGVEFITSMFEVRANRYNAVSGAMSGGKYDTEAALDGRDFKLTANLPYFYSSNVYFTDGQWKDGAGYVTNTEEFGLKAELLPNAYFTVSSQQQDLGKRQQVASFSYTIPLGKAASEKKKMQDGSWSANLKPIREKLYEPVQRENKIMKKSVKLGVIAAGV
tara:strand:- start:1491 stop:2474 length:984 start_codon:yes stop_codon:yes gene_type:complete